MARIFLSALSARRGGGLTYLRNVIGAFPSDAGHRLSILSATPIEGMPPHPDVEWIKAPAWTTRPLLRFLLGSLYFRFFWPLRNSYDAAYFAGGSVDVPVKTSIARIVAFRNMTPFDNEARRRHPLGLQYVRIALLRYVQARAFRNADLVIFISQYARNVIDRIVPNRRGTSVVIPHGTSITTTKLAPEKIAQLPDRFVLYLSGLDYYKAQVELVQAWAVLKNSGRRETLVLAGPNDGAYADKVRETVTRLGLTHNVMLLGAISHDQVSDLCRRALFNVFLSSCENCPNILLELLAVGVPILASSYQPMPELGGAGLDYVDPYDIDAVAGALAGLLDNPDRRDAIAHAALEQSRRYSWEKTGRATWQAILDCAERKIEGRQDVTSQRDATALPPPVKTP